MNLRWKWENNLSNSNYVAIIAEGKGERVVIDILLDNGCLIFNREDLLEEKVLATRNAKKFEDKHLTFKLTKPLHIYRIVDSNNDRFVIKRKDVDLTIHDCLTKPEIEMLIIHDIGKYTQFKNQGLKASEFLKQNLRGYHKGENYWLEYFESDVENLIRCLKLHDQSRPSGERTILSLIKEELL